MRIDPQTSLGAVRLRVRDLAGATAFYERAIGLRVLDRGDGAVRLGADDGAPLVELLDAPGATPRPSRTTGLFHLALLVPGRAELAAAVRRVAQAGWRFTGASDHLVSEAVYLHDPEGNGIEIYRDRPREEWQRRDGELQMATLPLDDAGVMAELPDEPSPQLAPETVLGHVHLNVADLAATEAFYDGALGFDVTTRGYPGALFLSAGGYHHHVGANTWNGSGALAPPVGSAGLDAFEVVLPSGEALDATLAAAEQAGVVAREDASGALVTDPSGNRVVLRAR